MADQTPSNFKFLAFLTVTQKEIHVYQDNANKSEGFTLMSKLFKGAKKKKLTLVKFSSFNK
ncbi:MAG: hypothetical protein M3388_13435 [Acidobacteriota bacterium]|nr:hypothetical protein [Acidobacteriota bacterium]